MQDTDTDTEHDRGQESSRPDQRTRTASPSSSLSSLTSSSSFDPHEAPLASPSLEEGRRPSALGLREISKLYRGERSRKGKEREQQIVAAGPISVEAPVGGGSPVSPGSSPGGGPELFASDVAVRGWRIVGGSRWSGKGRVGAYVGMCLLLLQATYANEANDAKSL